MRDSEAIEAVRMVEEQGWAVPPQTDWRLHQRQVDGVLLPYLEFSFGATCSCWVKLRLQDEEWTHLHAGGERAIRAFIRRIEKDEARWRHRLEL